MLTALLNRASTASLILDNLRGGHSFALIESEKYSASRKDTSLDLRRSKHSNDWICQPCKNNRHDLCVRQSSGRPRHTDEHPLLVHLPPTQEERVREGSRENVKRLPWRQPLSLSWTDEFSLTLNEIRKDGC